MDLAHGLGLLQSYLPVLVELKYNLKEQGLTLSRFVLPELIDGRQDVTEKLLNSPLVHKVFLSHVPGEVQE